VAKCRELGVEFDEWQHGIGRLALGKRADGSFAATVGGVVLSIPRQVGKTFLVGMIVVALCLLFPGLTVVWTAHRTRTATKTFQTLKAMTSRARVKPHMLEPRNANGEQEVRFRNGSVIMFGAREQGFGRGFDKVDIAVFDEAQILSEKGVEDIVPATNQAEMDGGALLFFMGTPPRPTDPGAEFTNRRNAALKGQTEDTVYVEFSADTDAGLDDQKQWAKANPSFPSRTPVASMKRMRANLTDDDSFRREALGIWTSTTATQRLLGAVAWQRVQAPKSMPGPRLAMAVHFTPDRSAAAVAVASRRRDGRIHAELIAHEDGV
jgi:phage terminase large subunit-like protein